MGGLSQLAPLAMVIILAGLIVSYGLQIQGDVKNDFVSGTLEYNATTDAQTAAAKIPDKMPALANIALAVIVISLLIAGFGKLIGLY